MHGIEGILIGLAVLIYFIVRQVTPRQPGRMRFYILPLVALVVAAVNLPHPIPQNQLWDALISVAISIPFGVMQAYFTTLYQKQGEWYIQGDWRYVVSWVVLVGLKMVTAMVVGSSAHPSFQSIEWIAALEVAVVWGLRSVVLHWRYPELSQILARTRTLTSRVR